MKAIQQVNRRDRPSEAAFKCCYREYNRSANRSALSERAAQGNLSQFNGLDFYCPGSKLDARGVKNNSSWKWRVLGGDKALNLQSSIE
jgi:hypothetical protein